MHSVFVFMMCHVSFNTSFGLFSVGVLPEVASLSRDELEDLLGCEDKLTEFVSSLPQLAAFKTQCDQLVVQNEALASKLLLFCSEIM